MTDAEKAQRLLDRASRVMTYAETVLCRVVVNGHVPMTHVQGDFAQLCERLKDYLR